MTVVRAANHEQVIDNISIDRQLKTGYEYKII